MAIIRQSYSCSLDSMNHFRSLFGGDWVATGACMKVSYQTLLFLIQET